MLRSLDDLREERYRLLRYGKIGGYLDWCAMYPFQRFDYYNRLIEDEEEKGKRYKEICKDLLLISIRPEFKNFETVQN